ncbi:hypothetical protein EDC65_0007 [Stella humosa]|uniref:Uncharacterized protein n=1 Tax=Stella humosa TaxID=94 RepID=A0A3N1MJD2_9PROT|nr:hypothetical protein [Stella humosa]ROQ03325.1 hypothetical protein EDC65_0007 [Stella humosa]BBK29612.1 hypothetical protein STHU_02460 [Stella humosa]
MELQTQTSPIFALDSVTQADERCVGLVLIAASHGGVYSGYLAAKAKVRAAVFNDAGVGLDQAGIGGLAYLEALGVPAAAVYHSSCRIGDARDMVDRGLVSHANAPARQLGCVPGIKLRDAAARLVAALSPPDTAPPATAENRFLLRDNAAGPNVWGLDSASLVQPEDAGHIVVTGSHGGLMGGDATLALKADALAAVFNDAGLGIDNAGVGRLRALNQRGIAAVTVSHMSARIGDARSAWQTGRLSYANQAAATAGAQREMTVAEFCERVLAQHQKG